MTLTRSRMLALPVVNIALKRGIQQLGAPWSWWAQLRSRYLRRAVVDILTQSEKQIELYSAHDAHVAVDSAVEQVLGPYRNRLTLVAYGLLLGSVGMNAYLVTILSHLPAMAAFVATLGGTLSAALGFQVLARLQAWAKQLSSNGGSLRTEQIPFNAQALDIWRRSQQVKSDLPRDGRNIRKDAWLQLHPRFEKALSFQNDHDAIEAIADAIIDHRQSFGEVTIDFWLSREFARNLKDRFGNARAFEAIRKVMHETQPIHGLPIKELEKILALILPPETWQGEFTNQQMNTKAAS